MNAPRLVIAGTQSGVGKTSVTLALTRALAQRGLRVQTFKVGPDFLDPTYLSLASGRPCYNLDGWMMGREHVTELFARQATGADLSIIEGVMGLFDGASPSGLEGSTAEVACWLQAPVLLVANAHGMGRSLAALVKGFGEFESDLRLAGVIANRIGSASHRGLLAESFRAASLPPLLGGVKRGAFPELPSRHLGLVTADRQRLHSGLLDQLAAALEEQLPIEELVKLAHSAAPVPEGGQVLPQPASRVRVGLAHDQAFHFYYQDLFDAMEARGAELVRFSPAQDEALPADLDGLFLGGGYPEEAVEELSANVSMAQEIRRFAASGRPVYAECGGLMYLAQGFEDREGRRFPLVGLLPGWTRMLERRKALGYVEVTLQQDSLWAGQGECLRGHEFHYSDWVGDSLESWNHAYSLRRRRTGAVGPEGFQRGSVLASYVHAHYASRPETVGRFLSNCKGAPCIN